MRPRRRTYILLLPSVFTTGNLFCGFYAIIQILSKNFEHAAYAIFVAGFFDVLDGRVARLTRSTSRFGVEYDSISDVVSFGMAPAILTYVWQLNTYGRLGWASSFFFAACGALRLARFNAMAEDLPKAYFLGVPIPAAAFTIAALNICHGEFQFSYIGPILLIANVVLGLLMVSSIRYRSFKDLDFRQRSSIFPLVLVVTTVTAIAIKHELALALFFVTYILWGAVRELVVWMKHPSERHRTRFMPKLISSDDGQAGAGPSENVGGKP